MDQPASRPEPFYQRYAWLLVAGLAVLLSLSVVVMMATGADPPMQFEADTGVEWAEFVAAYPTVATLVSLEDLLLGASFGGFGLLIAIIAATKFRTGDRWAWRVLWIFPAVLAVTAVLMITHDQAYVAYYYIGATVIAAVGLILPARKFLA